MIPKKKGKHRSKCRLQNYNEIYSSSSREDYTHCQWSCSTLWPSADNDLILVMCLQAAQLCNGAY